MMYHGYQALCICLRSPKIRTRLLAARITDQRLEQDFIIGEVPTLPKGSEKRIITKTKAGYELLR